MPVIIRVLRDDDAVISMVDSDLFRETIRPSEKAFAYKMKYEAIKRKSGRKNGGQIDYHLLGRRTIEHICILTFFPVIMLFLSISPTFLFFFVHFFD